MTGRAAAILFSVLCACPCYAQLWDKLTNPRVRVTLTHPPGSSVKVQKIALALQKPSDCGDILLDMLAIDLSNGGMEVVERQRLEAILHEHELSLTKFADPQGKARMGKLLGPAAVLLVNVQRCQSEPPKRFRTEQANILSGKHIRHTAQTTFHLKGSTRIVDLTTGAIRVARPFDATVTQETFAIDECCPEPPSASDVEDAAMQKATLMIHRLFFPWTEERELVFFDDQPCKLNLAFRLLKAGDQQQALVQSLENVSACVAGPGIKPKVVWHAQYNVGMTSFLLGDYDKAIEYLQQASTSSGGDIVTETLAECRRAKQLAQEMDRVDERPSLDELQLASRNSTSKTSPAPARGPKAVATESASPSRRGQSDTETRLKKLKALYDQGVITKQEYERKKAEILKDL